MKSLNRRSFLKQSALATASLSVFRARGAEPVHASSSATASVVGANSEIRCAVVGFHGRGQSHIKDLMELKGTRLVALCDADKNVLDRAVQSCDKQGQKVQGYTDMRQLIENKDIDVVS